MSAQAVATGVSLKYVKTVGIANNGSNGRGFANPSDLALSRDGRIFVLDRCDAVRADAIRIGICNLDDEYLGEFGRGFGDGDDQFNLPVAMAFDSRDRLHVTDERLHRVTVFDSEGAFLFKWGQRGEGPGQLNGPAGIAFDSDDNAYIADQHSHRVQKFASDGKFLLGWGELGSGEGQFDMPWGVTVDGNGKVYVADWRNDRVQVFSPEGRFLAAYGEPGDGDGRLSRPSDVAVDQDGNIYVADWGNERVQVLGPDGSFQLKLRGQATVSKWTEEFFAANPDEWETRLTAQIVPTLPYHLSTEHEISAQTEPYFWGPVAVTLDGDGRLYVTETNRHRFQVYERA